MKYNNYDIDVYLRGVEVALEESTINRKKSVSITGKPSYQKRHVKNKRKVKKALDEINGNKTWNLYYEIKKRWVDSMDKPMTYYRGATKSGNEVFEEVEKMAKAFDTMGLRRGDHIVACMSNVPEVLTLLLAASKCGVIVNFVGDDFDRNYLRTIFNKTPGKKLFIGTDDKYEKIADLVEEAEFLDKVIVSLTDSLEDGKDPYECFDDKFVKFVNRVSEFKKNDSTIMSYAEFLKISEKWDCDDNGFARRVFYPAENGLELPLTITYTSGSTKIGYPKPLAHSNKSYISMARFHDSDLSRMPAMRNMRGLAHIPTHSNTNLASCISDVVSQTCTVAFEPIYDPKFLLYSMVINKPGFVAATRSHLIEACKQMKKYPDLAKVGFADALVVAAVGEGTTKGEERFINKALKEAEAGSEVLPLISTVLSIGGGDCEHGGLFFTLLKSLREKVAFNKTAREDYGMMPFQLADIAVLDENGDECGYEEYGRLVANSNCNMLGYLNKNATRGFYVMDREGRTWGDCKVWGTILKNGNVLVKGRYDSVVELSNGQVVPYFMIADKLMECPQIMSCEIVKPADNEDLLVAHIEFTPEEMVDECEADWTSFLLGDVEEKCQASLSDELSSKIVYRVRTEEESYPLTKSGKRSIVALEQEGIEGACKPLTVGLDAELISASEYLESRQEKAVQKVKKVNEEKAM